MHEKLYVVDPFGDFLAAQEQAGLKQINDRGGG